MSGKSLEQRKHRKQNIVMIADDDPIMRQLLCSVLGDIGEIIQVDSGYNIIEYYRHHSPDLVLLDVHLPDKEGTFALQELLAYDRDAYVVMVSGDTTPSMAKQTLHTGAKGYITKPFTRSAIWRYVLQCPTLSLTDRMSLEA
jgi:two-component system, chemotaxis family, chemotaxis protein CheY